MQLLKKNVVERGFGSNVTHVFHINNISREIFDIMQVLDPGNVLKEKQQSLQAWIIEFEMSVKGMKLPPKHVTLSIRIFAAAGDDLFLSPVTVKNNDDTSSPIFVLTDV